MFKKYLTTFQSKIVSHVRASPTDFVKVLTNPYFYKNFKFTSGTEPSKKQKEDNTLQEKQAKIDDFYRELDQGGDFSAIEKINHDRSELNISMNINKTKVKFTMFYDKNEDRYYVVENSYEIQKYFVLEFDEARANNGFGNNLSVIQYTIMNVNVGTSLSGRGQRGIEIDAKEFIAMRNIVHFNCANPFNQFGAVAKQSPEKELTAIVKE